MCVICGLAEETHKAMGPLVSYLNKKCCRKKKRPAIIEMGPGAGHTLIEKDPEALTDLDKDLGLGCKIFVRKTVTLMAFALFFAQFLFEVSSFTNPIWSLYAFQGPTLTADEIKVMLWGVRHCKYRMPLDSTTDGTKINDREAALYQRGTCSGTDLTWKVLGDKDFDGESYVDAGQIKPPSEQSLAKASILMGIIFSVVGILGSFSSGCSPWKSRFRNYMTLTIATLCMTACIIQLAAIGQWKKNIDDFKYFDSLNSRYTSELNLLTGCYNKYGSQMQDCQCHSQCKSCGYNSEPTTLYDCITCPNNELPTPAHLQGQGYCQPGGGIAERDNYDGPVFDVGDSSSLKCTGGCSLAARGSVLGLIASFLLYLYVALISHLQFQVMQSTRQG